MARVIDSLRAEGIEVRDEDIARLSPARFEHFDRYGKYRLDNVPKSGQFRRILAEAA
jgi:rRNA maturation protein Nop10